MRIETLKKLSLVEKIMSRRRIDWERMNHDLSGILLARDLSKELDLISPKIELTRGDKPPRLYVAQPLPSVDDFPHTDVADCELIEAHEQHKKNTVLIVEVMGNYGLELVKGIKDIRGDNARTRTAYQPDREKYVVSSVNQNA
jgi:hypothetical protein